MPTPKPFQMLSQSSTSADGITAAATIFIGEDGKPDCKVSVLISDEAFKRMLQQHASDERAT